MKSNLWKIHIWYRVLTKNCFCHPQSKNSQSRKWHPIPKCIQKIYLKTLSNSIEVNISFPLLCGKVRIPWLGIGTLQFFCSVNLSNSTTHHTHSEILGRSWTFSTIWKSKSYHLDPAHAETLSIHHLPLYLSHLWILWVFIYILYPLGSILWCPSPPPKLPPKSRFNAIRAYASPIHSILYYSDYFFHSTYHSLFESILFICLVICFMSPWEWGTWHRVGHPCMLSK